MSVPTSPSALHRVRLLTTAGRLNVAGLLLTAAAMLLQVAAGSTLYPSLTGPIVLTATALAVGLLPGRWTTYLGLAVPLVLGAGAIVAAAMTGGFVDQLTGTSNPALLLGSVLHVVGLGLAVAGGLGLVRERRTADPGGR